MTEYEVTVKVTDQELDNAQFGSVSDMTKVLEKVIVEAKKKGYKEMF